MNREQKAADADAAWEKLRLHNESIAIWAEERAKKLKENNDQPN